MNFLAQIISAVFAPLTIIVPAAFGLAYIGTHDLYASIMWFLITLSFIVVLSTCIFILIKFGKFSNFDVSIQKQRPLLILLEFIFAIAYFLLLYFLNAPRELFFGIINIFVLLVVLLIVNKFIKASGHVAMFSAVVTFLFLRNGIIYLIIGSIFTLILAWSRLKLKRHTLKEVLIGLAIGVLVSGVLTLLNF